MKRNVLLLTLAIGLLASSAALAQSNLGLEGVGVAVGYVSPEDFDGTLGFGVFANHGFLAPRWGLESRLDYWSQSEGAYGVEATVSDVTLGARSKYYFESKSTVRPFAGVGLGLHFLHAEVVTPPQFGFPETRVEDSSTKLGLDVGGGIAAPLGPRTDFLGEAWYGIVSDVSQFSLRAGLSYALK
jgi:hypothetical protein